MRDDRAVPNTGRSSRRWGDRTSRRCSRRGRRLAGEADAAHSSLGLRMKGSQIACSLLILAVAIRWALVRRGRIASLSTARGVPCALAVLIVASGCSSDAGPEALRAEMLHALQARPCEQVSVALRCDSGCKLKPVEYVAWMKVPERMERVLWYDDVLRGGESRTGFTVTKPSGSPRSSRLGIEEMLLAGLPTAEGLRLEADESIGGRPLVVLTGRSGEHRVRYWIDRERRRLVGAIVPQRSGGSLCYYYADWGECDAEMLEPAAASERSRQALSARDRLVEQAQAFCDRRSE
jgi:hypothetical protein